MATAAIQNIRIPDKDNKNAQLQSLIGPLLSNNSYTFDEFQLILFDLISNASDDGIRQYFDEKSKDIHRFILTLFITSLHKDNPRRKSSLDNLTPIKKDNPLNTILVTPEKTLPPPPKRRNSDQQNSKSQTNKSTQNNNLSQIEESTEQKTDINVLKKQISTRNKDFFDDILDDNNEQSQTNESYDGTDFLATRTVTSREYTTTEKFECNSKEKEIVSEWRHLLHDVKLITPSPQPLLDINDSNDTDNNNEKEDDAVLVASAEDIQKQQMTDDDDVILTESAEMIAPMTRIRGKLKLTSTSITFVPNKEQSDSHKYEINLAMNPPPLPMAENLNSSRGRSSSYGVKKTNKLNLNQSLSNASSPKAEKKEIENDNLKEMVLNNEERQYWVTTSVCSSYQQVGGTRYRLMTAHRFWFIDELREIYYRRYQLRNCALELFFSDDTSFLFNLNNEEKRNKVFDSIMKLKPSNLIEKAEFFSNPKRAIKSSQIHYKWCRREISNFEYLMRLNILAGRTFNDLTQYPVVPWVITDFESESIDLSDESIYRDLSKPIGALNEDRLQKFVDRYQSLCEDVEHSMNNVENEDDFEANIHCFMYGTHYSSIGIVLYYLLRMQPFTTYNLKFQGGKFDQADRLFHSVFDTWRGCLQNTSDVKELIPEFYYLTDFFVNKQSLELGQRQNEEKSVVDDVELPPWAQGSAEIFVQKMREALESEYVSSHLHLWIDLIFGYKQRGTESIKANNIFHPYTYEGNVDIDSIQDSTQRRAILSQIDEFGQTPLQLFKKAHPRRLKKSEVLTTIFQAKSVKYYSKQQLTDANDIGIASMHFLEKSKAVIVVGTDCCVDVHKWEANKLSIEKKKKSSMPVSISKMIKMGKSQKNKNKIGGGMPLSDKISHKNLCFASTSDAQFIFACGFEDCSFVVFDVIHSKHYQGITEHQDVVSCLALDEDLEKQKGILVTGSYDKTVMVWRININAKNNGKYSGKKLKRAHTRKNSLGLKSPTASSYKLNELIDPHPTHVLDNQLAGVLCVDVSLKSGIIVCCSLDGIVNVYNSSTGEHYHMLQPFIDKQMKINQKKEEVINENDEEQDDEKKEDEVMEEDEEEINLSPSLKAMQSVSIDEDRKHLGSIPSGELTIVKVSDVFGHVLCYSKQTKDIFLYSSAGELVSFSTSRDDTYFDIAFSKTGNHIVCGGTETIVRVKELPSFKTRKKFEDAKKQITHIHLDKDETYMFVGLCDGNVLVYSLPQKAFVKSRVHTLTELGF